ncbi:MAG: hypothetical protein QNK04_07455, partial [Myxococcota bacterium]|nr:hypothetical protein [Myxococcota bacterium]
MPPPDISTFDDVVLTILAVDRDGGRELIFTDEGLVGALWPGSGFTVNFDTLGNVRGSLRNDGMVELTIEPIARPGKQNAIQILGTRVAANVHPIPEPHAAATYAIGLLIAGAAVRRRR